MDINLHDIHWFIVGGESGVKARPMKQEWVLNVKRQCDEQGAAFFFKQWGGWGLDGKKRGKKENGRLLMGRTWDGVPTQTVNRKMQSVTPWPSLFVPWDEIDATFRLAACGN